MTMIGVTPEQFLERIRKLEEQNKIMRESLEEINGYWGACGDDCEHPSEYGLYEFVDTTLEKCKEIEHG